MMRHFIAITTAIALMTVCACSDDADSDQPWDVGEGVDAGSDDVVGADASTHNDAEIHPRPDAAPADADADIGDADIGSPSPSCEPGEANFPPETSLPKGSVSGAGHVPRIRWQEVVESSPGVPAEINHVAVGRGLRDDSPDTDMFVLDIWSRRDDDALDIQVGTMTLYAQTGDISGSSGTSWNTDQDIRPQAEDLPATRVFPSAHSKLSFGALRPASPHTQTPRGPTIFVSHDHSRGRTGLSLEGLPFVEFPLLTHLALLADGTGAALWGGEYLIWLDGGDPEDDRLPVVSPYYGMWSIEDLWHHAPDQTTYRWLRATAPEEMLVAIGSADSTGADRLYRFDPCKNPELLLEAAGIGDEVLKTGEDYILTQRSAADDGASVATPVLVSDGEVAERLQIGCRDIVQYASDGFACLHKLAAGDGFGIVRFDRNLDVIDREPVPADYEYARLKLAGADNALVLLALHHDAATGEDTPRVLYWRGGEFEHIDLPALSDDVDTIAELDRSVPALTPDGILVVGWHSTALGIQTDVLGLAPTAFPRVRYGGNQNHGFVMVH
jgi:hypothetical protein